MTADSGADQPTLRDQLAEALLQWWEGEAAESLRALPEAIDSAYEYADAMLPVIEADRERAVADALHRVAAALDDQSRACDDDEDERGRAAFGWAAEVARAALRGGT